MLRLATTRKSTGVSERIPLERQQRTIDVLVPPQGRRRRQRTVFTQTNVQQLDSVFIHNQYPDIELREALAAQMGVPESRIQVRSSFERGRRRP